MAVNENHWQQEISESFGLIFLLGKKLEYVFDKILCPHNLTMKQWFVLAAIEKLFKEKPSIKEVARQLGTSHQNIKAIALNLERRGFVTLESDPKDKRVTRLSTTSRSREFWQKRESEDKALLAGLFKHLTSKELVIFHRCLGKIMQGVGELSDRIDDEIKERDYEESDVSY